ncbi:hypothetical protein [Aquimarina litoralis]|uniref:hypothetical protein n=1 Tax=Aquimarina litoralis TaxID=584605 RepID=UPI001C5724ED|nr:hypothetical protein [Aquimarina litoralis]MBW1297831.1 hypothetical protein [Aquimarina litoralis]
MNKLESLTTSQLEWLEAVKYDELLQAMENHKKRNTKNSLHHWDKKESEYLMVINQMERIIRA